MIRPALSIQCLVTCAWALIILLLVLLVLFWKKRCLGLPIASFHRVGCVQQTIVADSRERKRRYRMACNNDGGDLCYSLGNKRGKRKRIKRNTNKMRSAARI